MSLSVCPVCGGTEARERCCWPMPDSPLEFFGPDTWLDDDAIDREIIAMRLGGGEMDAFGFADALGICVTSVRTMQARGELPKPSRTETVQRNRDKGMWTAEQVADVVIRRQRVPA